MFHQHKNSDPAIFVDPRQNFVDPRDPHDLCQSLAHATHEPMHSNHPRHPRYLTDS